MKAEWERYRVPPDTFWQAACFLGDGYDVMGMAEKHGWHAIGGWGKSGWDLGDWPYVMIYFRDGQGRYDLIYYVEGDVWMYSCPTQALRNALTDELAFYYWKQQDARWVREYVSVDELPAELRGPCCSA